MRRTRDMSLFLALVAATALVAGCQGPKPCAGGAQQDESGQCVCPAVQEMYKGQCTDKCAEGQVRGANGVCGPEAVVCKADEDKVDGACLPKCQQGEVRDQVTHECIARSPEDVTLEVFIDRGAPYLG